MRIKLAIYCRGTAVKDADPTRITNSAVNPRRLLKNFLLAKLSENILQQNQNQLTERHKLFTHKLLYVDHSLIRILEYWPGQSQILGSTSLEGIVFERCGQTGFKERGTEPREA